VDINNLLASMTGNTQQRIGTIQAQVGDMQQDTAAMRSLMDANMQAGQQLAMGAGVAAAKEA
jgi:glutamate mutase epsilon subunit